MPELIERLAAAGITASLTEVEAALRESDDGTAAPFAFETPGSSEYERGCADASLEIMRRLCEWGDQRTTATGDPTYLRTALEFLRAQRAERIRERDSIEAALERLDQDDAR